MTMGPIGSPETSVSNHLTTLYNPEDGIIQFYRARKPQITHGGNSLPSEITEHYFYLVEPVA
jgi:hypothetical protein